MFEKYKVKFRRGAGFGSLIILYKKQYYLIDMDRGTKQLADPPDKPDMFTKWGYFSPVTERIPDNIKDRIKEIMEN